MQPKTTIQKRVFKLSKNLPDLTKSQLIWGHNLFDRYKFERTYDYSCFECGHRFPKSKRKTCPKCGSKLQLYKGKKKSESDYWYMAVFTTLKEFQVLRYFRINKYMKVDQPADYYFYEVYQHWISNTGKYVLISKLVSPFSNYHFDPWSRWSKLEVRGYPSQSHLINDVPVYPKQRILPELIRNGFYHDYYDYHPAQLFNMLLSSHIAETFVKANNIEMLRVYSRYQKEFTKYWHAYKICMRHKFKIKDWSTWFDHMKLLTYFKYDTHNPKYICSSTFIDDHNRLLKRKAKIDERIREEKIKRDREKYEAEQRAKDEKDQKLLEKKKRLLDIKFSDNVIKIVALKDLEDFKIEGEVHQHCVYSGEYYSRPRSLILSARKGETRLETIEFDIDEFKVLQCRGYENKSSKYHNRILRLINNNIDTIKQLSNDKNETEIRRERKNCRIAV